MGTLDNTNNKNSEFNWDEINVGDYNLDHSENFFAAGSSKMGNAVTYISTPKLIDCDNKTTEEINMDHADLICAAATANKENMNYPYIYSNTPLNPKREHKQSRCKRDLNKTMESILQLQLDQTPESSCGGSSFVEQSQYLCKQEIEDEQYEKQLQLHLTPHIGQLEPCKSEIKEDENGEKDELREPKTKLKLKWTPGPTRPNADVGAAVVVGVPRAYECKDMYRAKREMALRLRDEEERKAREFHSKPVPNFKAMHKRLAESIVIHRITIPVTPETVKHSKKWREHQAKMDEQKQSENSKSAPRRPLPDSKPFQLHADQRVRERREYDIIVQHHQLQKKLQEDAERKEHEMAEIKELRKRTEFKARPNPFNK